MRCRARSEADIGRCYRRVRRRFLSALVARSTSARQRPKRSTLALRSQQVQAVIHTVAPAFRGQELPPLVEARSPQVPLQVPITMATEMATKMRRRYHVQIPLRWRIRRVPCLNLHPKRYYQALPPWPPHLAQCLVLPLAAPPVATRVLPMRQRPHLCYRSHALWIPHPPLPSHSARTQATRSE